MKTLEPVRLLRVRDQSVISLGASGGQEYEAWFDGGATMPSRMTENILRIPWTHDMELSSVNEGSQLVVSYPPRLGGWFRARGLTIFCGRDEELFISRIQSATSEVLREYGEAAFFNALKPEQVKKMEHIWGTNAYTRRQGDIFFHPVGQCWMDFLNNQASVSGEVRENRIVSGEPIFAHLRHFITGQKSTPAASECCVAIGDDALYNVEVGEGVISAPDHVSQKTKSGPNIFVRANNLLPPPSEAEFAKYVWD